VRVPPRRIVTRRGSATFGRIIAGTSLSRLHPSAA
jgi:hypothetical protein